MLQSETIKKHDKYKDSGIEWIGKIPDNWDLIRLQFCIDEIKEKNQPIKSKQVLSLVKDKGVMLYEEKGNLGNVAKEDITEYKLAYPNTLILNSMNILIGSVGISNYFGCVSPVYYVFKETNKSDLRFINYIFTTREFQKELRRYANGIMEIRLRVSAQDIFKRQIAFPQKKEQQAIADYLDKKCGEIDNAIETEKNVIEKLKEYKQSVITETVTKGLDKSVELKDSGIEWIGKIPKHWEIKRLKQLISKPLQYGANESGDIYNEEYPRYIRITDIKIEDNTLKDDGKLSLAPNKAKDYILENDDILFARSGATVGKTFIYKSEYGIAAFAGYLIRARIDKNINARYIYYFTLSNAYEEWKNRIFIQATIQNIGANKYNNLEISLPKLTEQESIICYLDTKCFQIDETIKKKEELIEKLTEYKKSLIYECVTGKRRIVNV